MRVRIRVCVRVRKCVRAIIHTNIRHWLGEAVREGGSRKGEGWRRWWRYLIAPECEVGYDTREVHVQVQ